MARKQSNQMLSEMKLFAGFSAAELWEADQEASIKCGNANWPTVLTKNQDNP